MKEYKPTILFLAKFLGLYFMLNIFYALYIESYDQLPDPVTWSISEQTSFVLKGLGYPNVIEVNPLAPTALFTNGQTPAVHISVYEGCNGINVAIIFLSFMVAFGGNLRAMSWFIPMGFVFIHVMNLVRIAGLYIVSESFGEYFYFFHKYLFTAILYVVIFLLWVWWVILVKRYYSNVKK